MVRAGVRRPSCQIWQARIVARGRRRCTLAKFGMGPPSPCSHHLPYTLPRGRIDVVVSFIVEDRLSTPTARANNVLVGSRQVPTMNDKINLEAKLASFSEHYQPRTVAQMNDHDVMVVKLKGPFIWHKHDETDDFFLVLRGSLDIELRDRVVTLGPGELFVVPKGVEHRPVAREEVHLLLIEPTGTPNTGDVSTAAPRRLA